MRLSLILWTWPSQKKHALPDGGVHIGEISTSPKIIVNNYELEMVDTFTYLGSKISSKLSFDRELDTRISMATSKLWKLAKKIITDLENKRRIQKNC